MGKESINYKAFGNLLVDLQNHNEKIDRINDSLHSNRKFPLSKHIGAIVGGEVIGSIADSEGDVKQLLAEYTQKVVQAGYGKSKQEIKSMDMINIIPICEYKGATEAVKKSSMPIIQPMDDRTRKFVDENWWYCNIPCFSSGVLRVNIGKYIYWEVKSIDAENGYMSVFLHDYMYTSGIWEPGVSGLVHCTFTEDGKMTFTVHNQMLFPDIYTLIPYKDLKWNKQQIAFWEEMVLAYAKDTEKALKEKGTDNVAELAKIFFCFIRIVNAELMANKPRLNRSKGKGGRKHMADSKSPAKKAVRDIGRISIQSKAVPHAPTRDTVVRYKTPSWKCRGGIRKMKSGKLVPFKPCVKHRKCLEGVSNNSMPQVVLNIKGNKAQEGSVK